MSVGDILFLSYLILSYIAGALISMNIILENRDPAKTMTWLLIFILLPGIGIMIYAVFGRNIRKRKMLKTQKLATDIKDKNLFELGKLAQQGNDMAMLEIIERKKKMIKKYSFGDEDRYQFIILKLIEGIKRYNFEKKL